MSVTMENNLVLETNTDVVQSKEMKGFQRMLYLLYSIDAKILDEKKRLDTSRTDIKNLRKEVEKLQKKQEKSERKPKKPRQPHGFAKPTIISDELCVFLGKEQGTLVSRTEVTKSIIKYISDNKLQNPENRRHILMDTTLKKLFGPETDNVTVDYFSMQKYVNKHFPKTIT
jgi:chromatin remodeling complex protein RSC6